MTFRRSKAFYDISNRIADRTGRGYPRSRYLSSAGPHTPKYSKYGTHLCRADSGHSGVVPYRHPFSTYPRHRARARD